MNPRMPFLNDTVHSFLRAWTISPARRMCFKSITRIDRKLLRRIKASARAKSLANMRFPGNC